MPIATPTAQTNKQATLEQTHFMDPINPLDGLAKLLRQRMANENLSKGKTLGQKESASANNNQQRITTDVLKQRIVAAVDAIDPNDPERKRKAARLFVENVLTWQFGEELINDPAFSELVENVQLVIEREPDLIGTLSSPNKIGDGKN